MKGNPGGEGFLFYVVKGAHPGVTDAIIGYTAEIIIETVREAGGSLLDREVTEMVSKITDKILSEIRE